MKRLAALALVLLFAACGNSGIELNNGSGMDIETISLTIGENSETWTGIAADETFRAGFEITDSTQPVQIEWNSGGETYYMEYALIENAQEANRISILFAPDEISINYSF